jgi:hypothetical protein
LRHKLLLLRQSERNKTEAAYQRGDMLEKHRRFMDAWADFCAKHAPVGAVVTGMPNAGIQTGPALAKLA